MPHELKLKFEEDLDKLIKRYLNEEGLSVDSIIDVLEDTAYEM